MMQRAPHFVAHNDPFGERSAVVRTLRTHREEFIAAASDDHIFVTDLSLGHRAIRNLSDRNSVAEVSFCPAIHIYDLSWRCLQRTAQNCVYSPPRRGGEWSLDILVSGF